MFSFLVAGFVAMLRGKTSVESLIMEVDLLDEEINSSIWKDSFVNALFAMSRTIHHLGIRGLGDVSLAMVQE